MGVGPPPPHHDDSPKMEVRRLMFRPIRALAREPEGKVLIVAVVLMLATGTAVYSILEGWSLVDALYFSVVTLGTVGFGDLHPTTDATKLFTVGYILAGVGIIATFASELAKHRGVPPRVASRMRVPADETIGGPEPEPPRAGETAGRPSP